VNINQRNEVGEEPLSVSISHFCLPYSLPKIVPVKEVMQVKTVNTVVMIHSEYTTYHIRKYIHITDEAV
jgi:hypothetical protein